MLYLLGVRDQSLCMGIRKCGKGPIVGQRRSHTPPAVSAMARTSYARSPENLGDGDMSPTELGDLSRCAAQEANVRNGSRVLGCRQIPWTWHRVSRVGLIAVTDPSSSKEV
jgi:hypothetical protein